MTPAELDAMLDAREKRRPVTAALPKRETKLKDWLPIILTTLAIAGAISVFIFKTNAAAGDDHRELDRAIGAERETNGRQDERIKGFDGKLDLILEAVK